MQHLANYTALYKDLCKLHIVGHQDILNMARILNFLEQNINQIKQEQAVINNDMVETVRFPEKQKESD